MTRHHILVLEADDLKKIVHGDPLSCGSFSWDQVEILSMIPNYGPTTSDYSLKIEWKIKD